MKSVAMTKGVDFAREERLEISNSLTDLFRGVFKSNKMKKYKDKES